PPKPHGTSSPRSPPDIQNRSETDLPAPCTSPHPNLFASAPTLLPRRTLLSSCSQSPPAPFAAARAHLAPSEPGTSQSARPSPSRDPPSAPPSSELPRSSSRTSRSSAASDLRAAPGPPAFPGSRAPPSRTTPTPHPEPRTAASSSRAQSAPRQTRHRSTEETVRPSRNRPAKHA